VDRFDYSDAVCSAVKRTERDAASDAITVVADPPPSIRNRSVTFLFWVGALAWLVWFGILGEVDCSESKVLAWGWTEDGCPRLGMSS
jgi:hypothetical protein